MGDNPGFLIAFDMILLYIIMGPVVLGAVFILFDHLATADFTKDAGVHKPKVKKVAFWTIGDVWKKF